MDVTIKCGFNIHDETMNFGNRGLAENESYESVTLATLKSWQKISNTPLINTKIKRGQLFYSIDNLFGIFKDREYSSLEFSYVCDGIIDDICVMPDTSLVFIFMRDGDVKIIKKGSDGYEFHKTLSLMEKKQIDRKLFIESYFENPQLNDLSEFSIIVVVNNGQILRMSVKNNQTEIFVHTEVVYNLDTEIDLSAFNFPHLFLKGSKMCVIDLNSEDFILYQAPDIVKAEFSNLNILALLISGELIYICPFTLSYFPLNLDMKLHKLSILVNEQNSLKSIVVESMENENRERFLQYLNPDFSIFYSIKMSQKIEIVTPEKESDDIQYIALHKSENEVEEFRFQCVYETDPEKRICRLLRRNMFEEAEIFAKTHNIDMNVLNKEKAQLILEKSKCTTQDIDNLINILSSLKDDLFVLDCCSTVESMCENPADILRILKLGNNLKVDKKNLLAKEKQLFCTQLYLRFKIFLSLGYKFEKWNEFSKSCLLDELKSVLREEKIDKAILLYTHIENERSAHTRINQNLIEEIINILDILDLKIIESFLPTFFTVTLKHFPAVFPFFAWWIEKKILNMESRYPENFPQNAIEFLGNSKDFLNLNNMDNVEEYKSCVRSLIQLMECLRNIEVLKSNFGVTTSLKSLNQEPIEVVKVLLKLELSPNLYNKMLQEFAFKFILNNGLNPEEIFFDGLNDLLNYKESYWINIVKSILNYITSIDRRIQAVEKILFNANMPWNSAIREIAIETMDCTHPDAHKIRKIMEDEQWMIVLNKQPYKLRNYTLSSDYLEFAVNRIISCNLPTMVDDAFQLCQKREEFEIEVMRLLLHHFFEKRDFGKAFQLFDEKKSIIDKCFLLVLEDILNLCEDLEISELEHYFNALHMLTEKCYLMDGIDLPYWQRRVTLLQNIHNFSIYFNLNVAKDRIDQIEGRNKIINQILTNTITDYEDGLKSISDLMESCHHLSLCTGECKEEFLLQCCTKVENNKREILNRVIEEFLNNCDSAKYLSILTVYLLQNLNINVENQVENSFIDYNNSVVQESSGKSFKSALDLITKAITLSNSHELIKCLKIAPWVDSIYFLKQQKNEDRSQIFSENPCLSDLNPSAVSILGIQKMFNMYTSFIVQFRHEDCSFLTHFNQNQDVSQDEFLNELKDFQRVVFSLNQDGESLLSYKLLTTLQNQLLTFDVDGNISKKLTEITKTQCIPNVIHCSLLKGSVNANLLHTSLAWCDSAETEKYIKHSMRVHRQSTINVAIIARIGVVMFKRHECFAAAKYCTEVLTSVKWWDEVKHLKIEYNKFFNANSKTKLEILIRTGHFDINQIKKFLIDYGLENGESYYLIYLRTLLLHWKPAYEIITPNAGKRELVIKDNQYEDLYNKCKDVIDFISHKDLINKLIHDVWGQVNFYHYEVFTCMLNITEENTFIHYKTMLSFLKTYERISEPTETEKEKWFNSFPESQSIDPLSEFRLLFNFTILGSKDIWNIIRKEISLKNYTTWFTAVQVFNHLTIDSICSFLVKEIIDQNILKNIIPGEWLYPKHTDLFMKIEKCLQFMENEEMKISAANCLLSHTPEGADQIIIAKITYDYAREYQMREISSPDTISLAKIEKKYQKCSCLQILHANNLTDQVYIDSIFDSEKLLTALYYDERIIKSTEYCPDINKAAAELATILKLDIIKFRETLLKNLLTDSESIFTRNISMIFSNDASFMQKSMLNDSENDMLKRAAYLCSSDVIFWSKYLLREGLTMNISADANSRYRSKCLKCLILFADVSIIKSLTGMDFASFMSVVDQETVGSILFKFDIPIDNLKTYSVITKHLAHIGSPDSIKALAEICKILKITKAKYWEYIIKSATRDRMFSDLASYLEHTRSADYRHESFYIEAWQKLIEHTISTTLTLDENEIGTKLLKDLFMIQQCPVIFFLDLENVHQKCLHAKQFSAAIFLLQYISEEKLFTALENLKNNMSSHDLSRELKLLKSHGLVITAIEDALGLGRNCL